MTRTRERQNFTSRLHTHTAQQQPIMATQSIRPAKSTRNRRWNIPRRHINSRWKRINNQLTSPRSTARRRAKPTESYQDPTAESVESDNRKTSHRQHRVELLAVGCTKKVGRGISVPGARSASCPQGHVASASLWCGFIKCHDSLGIEWLK